MDCFVKPLQASSPCKLSGLSNLTALTIKFQIRDVFIAPGNWFTDEKAVSKKLDAVLALLEQFLQPSTNLKKLNVILLMAGACDDRTDKDLTRIFYNNVDRLLGMEGGLVRGKTRSGDELFDDDGVLIAGYRATVSFCNYSRTDEFIWKAPRGQGLKVVKKTQRFAKDGTTQWF
jgi:hypothetical protein